MRSGSDPPVFHAIRQIEFLCRHGRANPHGTGVIGSGAGGCKAADSSQAKEASRVSFGTLRTRFPLLRAGVCLLFALSLLGGRPVRAQAEQADSIAAVAATASGSEVFVAVNGEDARISSRVMMLSSATGRVIWRHEHLPTIASMAVAPDGTTLAVGFIGVPDRDPGVILLKASSGDQADALGFDERLLFAPGVVYPRFGSGVSQLAYSPDGQLLYGLSNDTLFAWDVAARRYLWTCDVPAVIRAPASLPDPLPYGHATGFVLSPDGRQIAAMRDVVRVATAGRARPTHFIQRRLAPDRGLTAVAFSADSRTLAAGGSGPTGAGKTTTYATELWIAGALRPITIEGCGGEISADDIGNFACQNDGGMHLRAFRDPGKDIGAAVPVSALPLVKMGHSMWVAAYRTADWKDAARPFPLTLVELGTGKKVTVNVPGESAAEK
jgi:hypothetical protein